MNREIFTHNGVTLECEIEHDDVAEYPWERSDGHGPVRRVRNIREEKRAGETVLAVIGNGGYLYDTAAAQRIALRDGWGAPGAERPNESKKQRAARAVAFDFAFLRAYCAGEWSYVGVVVTHAATGSKASLWGIESDAGEYLTQVRDELAAEVCALPAIARYARLPAVISTLRAMVPDNLGRFGPNETRAISDAIELLTNIG